MPTVSHYTENIHSYMHPDNKAETEHCIFPDKILLAKMHRMNMKFCYSYYIVLHIQFI